MTSLNIPGKKRFKSAECVIISDEYKKKKSGKDYLRAANAIRDSFEKLKDIYRILLNIENNIEQDAQVDYDGIHWRMT